MPILVISLYQIGKLFSSLFDKIFKIVVINVYIHNILCFRAFLQAKKGFFGLFMRLIIIYASLKKETINNPPYIGRPKIYRPPFVVAGAARQSGLYRRLFRIASSPAAPRNDGITAIPPCPCQARRYPRYSFLGSSAGFAGAGFSAGFAAGLATGFSAGFAAGLAAGCGAGFAGAGFAAG